MKKSDGFFRYSPSLTEGQGGGTTRQRHCGGWSVKNPTDFFGTHPLFSQSEKGGGTKIFDFGGWSVKKRQLFLKKNGGWSK